VTATPSSSNAAMKIVSTHSRRTMCIPAHRVANEHGEKEQTDAVKVAGSDVSVHVFPFASTSSRFSVDSLHLTQ
jgi:hypothetical protein